MLYIINTGSYDNKTCIFTPYSVPKNDANIYRTDGLYRAILNIMHLWSRGRVTIKPHTGYLYSNKPSQ